VNPIHAPNTGDASGTVESEIFFPGGLFDSFAHDYERVAEGHHASFSNHQDWDCLLLTVDDGSTAPTHQVAHRRNFGYGDRGRSYLSWWKIL